MNFDRFRVQTYLENQLNCRNLNDWSCRRSQFENLVITDSQATELSDALKDDAVDLYYKGMLTLCEAINSIRSHLFSWSIVRLYYATFYLLRCSLAAKGYSFVRNKSLYLIRIKSGEKPVKKTGNRFRNDHIGTIRIFEVLFGQTDKLQSNNIDDLNPYIWLMNKRNQINYREREFLDPDSTFFFTTIASYANSNRLDELITNYIHDDDLLYCFQSDHACLALPIQRAIHTKNDLLNFCTDPHFRESKKKMIKDLLAIEGSPLLLPN